MPALKSVVWSLLPMLILVTGLCGLVEVVVQQSYRQGANDPQIELAQDAAKLLTLGVPASTIVPGASRINIDSSLSPWLALYDVHGAPVASSAFLHNTVPSIPEGIFTSVSQHGEDRVTWQPEPGVRQAIVVVGAADKGYAVAGRNLREVEDRESQLGYSVLAAWAVLMVGIVAATYWGLRKRKHRHS